MQCRQFDVALSCVSELPASLDVDVVKMHCAFEVGDILLCSIAAKRVVEQAEELSLQVDAFYHLGQCALANGTFEEAVANFKNALMLDPFCCSALSALFDGHLLKSEEVERRLDEIQFPPEAAPLEAAYRAKIQTIGPVVGAPPLDLLLRDGIREHQCNDLRSAHRLLTQALAIAPYHRDVICALLSVLVDMRNTSELFDFHDLQKQVARIYATYAIGCYYFALGSFDKAGRYFSRSIELMPRLLLDGSRTVIRMQNWKRVSKPFLFTAERCTRFLVCTSVPCF